MALYHFKLGFPKGFNPKVGTKYLNYTHHALGASRSDRYGAIELPKTINTSEAVCIEADICGAVVDKLVYRLSYNSTLDLCIVVVPNCTAFKVLTVWLNLKTDHHRTLNASRYVNPNQEQFKCGPY